MIGHCERVLGKTHHGREAAADDIYTLDASIEYSKVLLKNGGWHIHAATMRRQPFCDRMTRMLPMLAAHLLFYLFGTDFCGARAIICQPYTREGVKSERCLNHIEPQDYPYANIPTR